MARPPMVPAPPRALDACRRPLTRRLPWAARWTRAALWPPPAAALCRAAFAGGLVPFPVFERLLVISSPSSASLPWFIPRVHSCQCATRGRARPRRRGAAHLLLVPVLVSGAETSRSGRALVDGALRAALGMRGPLRRRPPAPRRRIGAEVPARLRA